nr:transposase [Candidatus Sigynarchaeum springense]
MSLAKDSAAIVEPREEEPPDGSKSFRNLTGLLSTITRRDASVDHEPGTVKKSAIMMLTAILIRSSLGAARVLLMAFVDIIIAVLEEIARAVDVMVALRETIATLKRTRGHDVLSLHPTTVNDIKPSMTRAEMENLLEDNYIGNMARLSGIGAVSPFTTLVMDDTGQTIRSCFGNNTFTDVKVGQKVTWEAGFEYCGVYDATHKQFLGGKHHDNPYPDVNKRSIFELVEYVRIKIERVQEAGSTVAVLEGDRMYFTPGWFACATLGKFTPSTPASQAPRLVTPWKFGSDKKTSKEKLILDMPDSGVAKAFLNLDPAKYPWLASSCAGVFTKDKMGSFQVPCARVVMVVNEKGEPEQSFKDFKIEYKELLETLREAEARLQDAEWAFVAHRTNLTGKPCTKPTNGRGKKRNKFFDAMDARLYRLCFQLHDEIKALKARKSVMICRLLVYAISLRPDEDPADDPETFIGIAHDYTVRWGIENGFKEVKHVFLRKIRSRKPTSRQFELMIAMMLYNDWQVERAQELVGNLRSSGTTDSLFLADRPWRRNPLENESKDLVTAVTFLIKTWAEGIKGLLIEKIKGVVSDS